MAKQKTAKRKDMRPARSRYWSAHVLMERKVKRLMRCNGFKTKDEARKYWLKVRQGRMRSLSELKVRYGA